MHPVFVNVYALESRYGGAEEGGWDYTCGTPVASKATTCVDPLNAHTHDALCPAGHWEDFLRSRYSDQAKWADSFTHDAHGVSYLDADDVPTEFPGEVMKSGSYSVQVETHPGEEWPTARPHYE
jgi:hypothetical protein